MADGWSYERDGFDTLRVPFVFIPEGASQPLEWLADHPDHIRMPAKFIPRSLSRGRQVEGAQRDPAPAARSDGSASPVRTEGTMAGSRAPIGPSNRRRFPPPPQIDRSGYFQESPVAAYLRVGEVFDRMGAAKPFARRDEAMPSVPAAVKSTASGESDYTAGVNPETSRNLPPDGHQWSALNPEGVAPDATSGIAPTIEEIAHFTRSVNGATAKALGMSRDQLGDAIHTIKHAAGLGGADDILIHIPTGNVFFGGEWIGNVNDE
ncbi:MAG: hypothetical protein ACREF3_16685 [Acetobacteraceae bacterium]